MEQHSFTKKTRSQHFRHFLCRRHPQRHVLHEGLPEVIATDGELIRRMLSQSNQVVYQEFKDMNTAKTLISRIESSITPGVAIVGYSTFKDKKAVSILHTAKGTEPGWVAFPDLWESEQPAQAPSGSYSTLPLHIANIPKLRLVAGATVMWERRKLVIKAALEQRGSAFAQTPFAFHMLSHLKQWKVETMALRPNGEHQRIELTKTSTPLDNRITRVNAHRVEASFEIEPMIFRELKTLGAQVWFEVRFDRELFCLPDDWARCWINVELNLTPGLLI